jgi:hypothetical protein
VDRVPYAARIDQWYNWHVLHGTMPEEYAGLTAFDVLRGLGAGLLGFDSYVAPDDATTDGAAAGFGAGSSIVEEVLVGVGVSVVEREREVTTEYRTPKGRLRTRSMTTEQTVGAAAIEVEHLFKDESDYPALEYLLSHTVVRAAYDGYRRFDATVGDDGVTPGVISHSPIHFLMRTLMGYDRFFYELHDNRRRVVRLLRVIEERDRQKVALAAASPAPVVEVCANWVDAIHVPVFDEFLRPWLEETSDVLHSAGKLVQVHADGEMKRLLDRVPGTGVDIAEAFTPVPMTRVTPAEAQAAWSGQVAIWGGIPSVMFEPTYSDEQFDEFVRSLIQTLESGGGFVIGMGDNVPPAAVFARVERVAELVQQGGG